MVKYAAQIRKDNSGNEKTQGFCCLIRTQALRPYLVVFSFLETSQLGSPSSTGPSYRV
jgi:hypothetical protein